MLGLDAHCAPTRAVRACEAELEASAPHVRALIARYGYGAIFVATDRRELATNARARSEELFGLPFTEIFAIQFSLGPNDSDAAVPTAAANAHARRASAAAAAARPTAAATAAQRSPSTRAAVDTILLLAETDGFVGPFSSDLARLALALSSARKGGDCLTPCISVDGSIWWHHPHARK